MGNFDRRVLGSAICVSMILVCRFCAGQQSSPEPNPPSQTSSTQSDPAQSPPAQATPSQTAPASLPDAPGAAPATTAPAVPAYEQQTKRIMGVLPNFRSVSAGAIVPKETNREKLITATEDNYDYTSLLFAGVIAADSFATEVDAGVSSGSSRLCPILLAHGGRPIGRKLFCRVNRSARYSRRFALLRVGHGRRKLLASGRLLVKPGADHTHGNR